MTAPSFSTNNYVVKANGTALIPSTGSFVVNLTSATAAGSLKIIFKGGAENRFDAGDTYSMPRGEDFDGLTVRNTTGADITVTVGIGKGEIRIAGQVAVSGTVSVTGSVKANVGTAPVSQADIACPAGVWTKVLNANAARQEAHISNLAANLTVVRWSEQDWGAGVAAGIEVPQGSTSILTTTAAIWIYNPLGGAITIGRLENI